MNVALGNLGLSACGLFTRIIVTHVSIRTRDTSSKPFDSPSQAYTTLLYRVHTEVCTPRASVYRLAPLNLPRRPTRPVSYYAFFKGWLLLSQPPGCAPAVCLLRSHVLVFGVCHGLLSRNDPLAITVLYPQQ